MLALNSPKAAQEWLYWPIATGLGLLFSITLLLSIPRLDQLPDPKPVKVIALDFFEWQAPPKPAPLKPPPQTLSQPQSKPKPKDQPLPIPKTPPFESKVPEQAKPKPVLSENKPPTDTPPPTPEIKAVEARQPKEAQLPQAVALAKLTAMPRFIHKEQPVYPPSMRAAGKEALVKLAVLIDARGEIRDIQIKKSAGAAFDQAAIDAVRKSSFSPGEIEQKAVTVLLTVPVKFKLR